MFLVFTHVVVESIFFLSLIPSTGNCLETHAHISANSGMRERAQLFHTPQCLRRCSPCCSSLKTAARKQTQTSDFAWPNTASDRIDSWTIKHARNATRLPWWKACAAGPSRRQIAGLGLDGRVSPVTAGNGPHASLLEMLRQAPAVNREAVRDHDHHQS